MASRNSGPAPPPARDLGEPEIAGPILQVRDLSKTYGGLAANGEINFSLERGELRGVIGPNGAGKSTFFKMLTCEINPSSGSIHFEGRDITNLGVTEVCQLGLSKSYQVNQLFTRLTPRENITIAALAEWRGKFRLDLLRNPADIPGLSQQVHSTLALVSLTERADVPVSGLARDRPRAGDVAKPAPARRAAGRHEPARAR